MDAQEWFRVHFEPAKGRDPDCDFRSRDGRTIVEFKARAGGLRDLRAAATTLASALVRHPEVRHGVLVLTSPRIAVSRATDEWKLLGEVFQPAVLARMNILLVNERTSWSHNPRGYDPMLEEWARSELQATKRVVPVSLPSPRSFEIWKLLVRAWLTRAGPMSIGRLVELSGTAHPTVARAVRRWEASGELVRHRDRSVEFTDFPRSSFAELRSLLSELRRTQLYADVSGQPSAPRALLRQVRKLERSDVAVGGVVAAEHYDRAFDLVGVPRVDLILHASDERGAAMLAQSIDPALRLTSSSAGAVLAVHVLTRAVTLFEADPEALIPFADPVETWLDLHELGLSGQAEDFVRAIHAKRSET